MTDPWQIHNTAINKSSEEKKPDSNEPQDKSLQFEDNFAPQTHRPTPYHNQNKANKNCNDHQPLPDSASYLQSLERKLEKIQKGGKLVEALGEKRQQCLRTLLQEDEHQLSTCSNNNELLELDTPIGNSESAVHGLYRHLQPVQALSVGEIVHIVKHDQFEDHKEESQSEAEEEDSENVADETVSTKSR